MELHEISSKIDEWVDDNCIITQEDAIEALESGEVIYAELVAEKLLEMAKRISYLEKLNLSFAMQEQKDLQRLLVLATKHCPKEHHDWQEILNISKDT